MDKTGVFNQTYRAKSNVWKLATAWSVIDPTSKWTQPASRIEQPRKLKWKIKQQYIHIAFKIFENLQKYKQPQ